MSTKAFSFSFRCFTLLVLLSMLAVSQRGVFKAFAGANIWTSNGPDGATVWSLAIDPLTPSTIYAGLYRGGVAKSTDGGATWHTVNTGLGSVTVYSLAIDPATPAILYVGIEGGGIFKSTNGGGQWNPASSNLPASAVRVIVIDPGTPTILYAGTSENGIFKSTDAGGSWNAVDIGSADASVCAMAIDPVTPAILYATTGYGMFKSTNGGENWNLLNMGTTDAIPCSLAIDPKTPSTVYVGGYEGEILKSTDGGVSWMEVGHTRSDNYVWAVVIDPATTDTIYAGSMTDGILKSTNGGDSWSIINTGLTDQLVWALAVNPLTPSTLYAGTYEGGIFKSTNGGTNWKAVNNGLPLMHIGVGPLAVDPVIPTTVYAGTNNGVFKSMNGGDRWGTVNTGLASTDIRALAINPQTSATIYAGTIDGVFKSTNGGGNWSAAKTGLTDRYIHALAIDPVTPSILYAGTYEGHVFKSTNSGGSWSLASNGMPGSPVGALAINPKTPTTLYAATHGAPIRSTGVYKSTDGGVSWFPVNNGLPVGGVFSLAIDPIDPETLYASRESGGLFKSTNGGVSWAAANRGLAGMSWEGLVMDLVTPGTLYAGTYEDGVFKSADGGESWTPLNTGIPDARVSDLAFAATTPATLYAATLEGVFVFNNLGTIPIVSSITRTGPNPTNTESVKFTVLFSEPVTGVNTTAPFDDFVLSTSGVTGASIIAVSGVDSAYTVTVNTGSGNGVIRLDVVDDDSIKDRENYSLGGSGTGNGTYTSGEVYTISKPVLPSPWTGGVSITSDKNVVVVGRPHIGNEIATYGGFTGGSLTAYLPMLFKGSFGGSYNSAFYIQNVHASSTATVVIKYYDSDGNLKCTKSDTIKPLASKGYWIPTVTCDTGSLPAGWVGGVVATSDQPIIAVGRPHVGAEVMTYDGFAGGDLASYIPMLFKDAFDGSYHSAFYIQNVHASNPASITIKYYDNTGTLSCTKTDTIAPLASRGYWVPTATCDTGSLPPGWVGGVVVSSDRPIVSVGRSHIGTQVTTYNGLTVGGGNSYVPMLFKGAFGGLYNSAFYLQNIDPGSMANIMIKYYDTTGSLSCTKADTIEPLASKGYWVPSTSCDTGSLPAGWVGGVVITSDRQLAAVGRAHIGAQIATYSGFRAGSLNSYLPMLFKDAFGGLYDSAFYLQNTENTQATVTVRFYDTDGSVQCTLNEIIPALSSKGYWVPGIICAP